MILSEKPPRSVRPHSSARWERATSPELTPVGERGHRQCPVCNSLLAGNLAGIFWKRALEERFSRPKRGQHQMVTGKLPAQRSTEFLLTEQGSLSREQGMVDLAPGGRADPTILPFGSNGTAPIGGQRIIEGGRGFEREGRAVAVTAGHIDRPSLSKEC